MYIFLCNAMNRNVSLTAVFLMNCDVDLAGLSGGSGYRSDRGPGGGSHPGD